MRSAGRKRVHHADEVMTRITVEPLVAHLEQRGFALMRQRTTTSLTTRLRTFYMARRSVILVTSEVLYVRPTVATTATGSGPR